MPGSRAASSAVFRPTRLRVLRALGSPATAAGVARTLGLPRQQVAYHLKALRAEGLVEALETRRRGSVTEVVLRATARAYLVAPEVLDALGREPDLVRDRFSSGYLVAAAADAIRDVAAGRARGKVATLTLQADVALATPAARKAFADELANAVARVVARHHDAAAPAAARHRLLVSAWASPGPAEAPEEDPA
ncbi:MAG: helix-turn-helix domain-containing protein [Anaeromyxobacter sp.]